MDVREALIDAAIRVFSEAGLRGATTRRIAQEADVNEVTLFRHFKSKDDLITAALEQFATRAHTQSPLPADPGDAERELIEWCRVQHRELHKRRALIRKAMSEYEEHPQHCAHGMQASIRLAGQLTDYLRRLKKSGRAVGDWDERAATAMLMGAVFTDAMGRDTMPERYPYSMRDAIEHYVRLLLTAIHYRGAIPSAQVSDKS